MGIEAEGEQQIYLSAENQLYPRIQLSSQTYGKMSEEEAVIG